MYGWYFYAAFIAAKIEVFNVDQATNTGGAFIAAEIAVFDVGQATNTGGGGGFMCLKVHALYKNLHFKTRELWNL